MESVPFLQKHLPKAGAKIGKISAAVRNFAVAAESAFLIFTVIYKETE
jgi:hypothetical protein